MTLSSPSLVRPLVAVDLFAGGGGASEGLKMASGVAPVVAVNHDEHAIAMHAANHPETIHFHQDVYDVNPAKLTSSGHRQIAPTSPAPRAVSRRTAPSAAWLVLWSSGSGQSTPS